VRVGLERDDGGRVAEAFLIINGREGDDQLVGDKGDDTLAGGVGENHNDGGQGTDTCLNPQRGSPRSQLRNLAAGSDGLAQHGPECSSEGPQVHKRRIRVPRSPSSHGRAWTRRCAVSRTSGSLALRLTVGRLGGLLLAAPLLYPVAAATYASPAEALAVPTCQGVPATIVGTPKPDWIRGTAGDDVIVGGWGNDQIYGNGGDDLICAGPSNNDTTDSLLQDVNGGPGDDTLIGGDSNDVLDGDAGADLVIGRGGDDFVTGSGSTDTLRGGPGADHLSGGEASDDAFGGPGDDSLDGNLGENHNNGGKGKDTCLNPSPGASAVNCET
jgi:Ca2+-binding RTX toxin-like protein